MTEDTREAVETLLGHAFNDPGLLSQALTHASIAETRLASNERLEFLGDAVLGIIACEQIYRQFPDLLEGEMTKIKSSVVSRQTCAVITRSLGLDELLRLGKGMRGSDDLPQSLVAAVLESVVGALYLDGGFDVTQRFLVPLLEPIIERVEASGHQENFKSVLQQHAQQHALDSPIYLVLDEKGPDHAKAFEVCVEIGVRRFPSSWGQSKKQAEQGAALNALQELGLVVEENGHLRVVQPETAAADDGTTTGNA